MQINADAEVGLILKLGRCAADEMEHPGVALHVAVHKHELRFAPNGCGFDSRIL